MDMDLRYLIGALKIRVRLCTLRAGFLESF